MKSVTSGTGWMARGWRRIAGFAYSQRQPMVGLTTRHKYTECELCEDERGYQKQHCIECGVVKEEHESYGTN